MKWVRRELVLLVSCQVRQGMKHDTWMTIIFRTQRCAILSLPALEPRVFALMKCDDAVQLCTCCICGVYCSYPVGWLRFFSPGQPKLS